jgi:DNA gyrase/topoisomerase IV subunit B
MAEPNDAETVYGFAAIRKRPAMFIGDVRDGSGLHHLLWETVANALDEHLVGRAKRLDVRIESEGNRATVEDDGRGISVAALTDGRTYLERVLTEVHASGTEDGHFPHVHIADSLRGIGLAVVCALSETLVVDARPGFVHYRQEYSRGRPLTPLEKRGPCASTGTSVSFVPDREIFGNRDFDIARVTERLQELAFLNPDLRVTMHGQTLRGGDGLGEYCTRIADTPLLVPHPLRVRGRFKDVDVDVALTWQSVGRPEVRSYVSQYRTKDGGSHELGFWTGLRDGLQDVDRSGRLARGLDTGRSAKPSAMAWSQWSTRGSTIRSSASRRSRV